MRAEEVRRELENAMQELDKIKNQIKNDYEYGKSSEELWSTYRDKIVNIIGDIEGSIYKWCDYAKDKCYVKDCADYRFYIYSVLDIFCNSIYSNFRKLRMDIDAIKTSCLSIIQGKEPIEEYGVIGPWQELGVSCGAILEMTFSLKYFFEHLKVLAEEKQCDEVIRKGISNLINEVFLYDETEKSYAILEDIRNCYYHIEFTLNMLAFYYIQRKKREKI